VDAPGVSVSAATRSTLQLLGRRLARVRRGASLLRRKREVLVAELFRVAKPALEARERIAARAERAWDLLQVALATQDAASLEALGLPPRDVTIATELRSVWGVEVPALGAHAAVARTLALRDQDPGTPGTAAEATTTELERLVDELLEAASREVLLERLGEQLARTTRQVNRLEQRVAPGLAARCAEIVRALEEREREDHVRLRLLARGRAGR
jgi:V/A-type H+/Na+-transporting ATPase subunit D